MTRKEMKARAMVYNAYRCNDLEQKIRAMGFQVKLSIKNNQIVIMKNKKCGITIPIPATEKGRLATYPRERFIKTHQEIIKKLPDPVYVDVQFNWVNRPWSVVNG